MDYQREDKIALKRALIALGRCPHCRKDLLPVRDEDDWPDVVGCDGSDPTFPHSPETWYRPLPLDD